MESQSHVKAAICLGSETYTVSGNNGRLSEQLVSMKEESMSILKDYITKNNAPADVPDEPLEGSSSDEDEISKKPKPKAKVIHLLADILPKKYSESCNTENKTGLYV